MNDMTQYILLLASLFACVAFLIKFRISLWSKKKDANMGLKTNKLGKMLNIKSSVYWDRLIMEISKHLIYSNYNYIDLKKEVIGILKKVGKDSDSHLNNIDKLREIILLLGIQIKSSLEYQRDMYLQELYKYERKYERACMEYNIWELAMSSCEEYID